MPGRSRNQSRREQFRMYYLQQDRYYIQRLLGGESPLSYGVVRVLSSPQLVVLEDGASLWPPWGRQRGPWPWDGTSIPHQLSFLLLLSSSSALYSSVHPLININRLGSTPRKAGYAKLDWVGPVENRPSTNQVHNFVRKKKLHILKKFQLPSSNGFVFMMS